MPSRVRGRKGYKPMKRFFPSSFSRLSQRLDFVLPGLGAVQFGIPLINKTLL